MRPPDIDLTLRSCVYQGSKEDMSQSIDSELVEVIFGEIQPKSAVEIFDSFLQFIPAKSGKRSGGLLKNNFFRCHCPTL
jgi:hypothetical protein